LLLTLPVCIWFLLRDQRNLQSIATVFLDELAKEQGLIKVEPQPVEKQAQKSEPPADATPTS